MFRIALGTQHVLNEYLLYELMRKRIAMPELLKYVQQNILELEKACKIFPLSQEYILEITGSSRLIRFSNLFIMW